MSRPHIRMSLHVLLKFYMFLVFNFYLMPLISLVLHMKRNVHLSFILFVIPPFRTAPLQYVASFLAGEEHTGAGGRAYWLPWRGEGWMFICLALHCDKVNWTYREKILDLTWCCISDSLVAYRMKIPPAKNRAVHSVFVKLVQPFSHCCKQHRNWLLATDYSMAALCSVISSTSWSVALVVAISFSEKWICNTRRSQATREDGGTQPFINGQKFLYWRSNERRRVAVVNQPVLVLPLSNTFPSVFIHTDLLKSTDRKTDS